MPEVESYFSNIGHGNPKIYYNLFPPESETNYGDVFVKLTGYDTQRDAACARRLARAAQATIRTRAST